jgi:hypothetical protein
MENKPQNNLETLLLNSDHPALNYFLERPRKLKYDVYQSNWYKIEWSEEALKLRHLKYLENKKIKYRKTHPVKEHIVNHIPAYLKKKMNSYNE